MASWPQLPRPDQKFPAPTRARPAGARRIPAQIRRVGAGGTSRGVPTPVPCVCLLVLLTRPDPSGSAEPARLCRGCSHPSRRPPGQAASSFTPPLRRQGDEGLSPPFDPTAPRGAPKSEPEPRSQISSKPSPAHHAGRGRPECRILHGEGRQDRPQLADLRPDPVRCRQASSNVSGPRAGVA